MIADRPKILFVGINPGIVSGTVGHHFAGKGNPFYQLLYAAALTPLELVAEQDQQLAGLGYGLINLCRRATKEASELTKEELARGKTRVLRQIKAMKPEIVMPMTAGVEPTVPAYAGVLSTTFEVLEKVASEPLSPFQSPLTLSIVPSLLTWVTMAT